MRGRLVARLLRRDVPRPVGRPHDAGSGRPSTSTGSRPYWRSTARRTPPGSSISGCGDGRIAVALSVRGHHVTGLDYSASMLAAARDRAAQFGTSIELVEADIRAAHEHVTGVDVALSWYTSFGYFDETADDVRRSRAPARRSRPGGVLLLETQHRDRVAAIHADSSPQRLYEERPDGIVLRELWFDPVARPGRRARAPAARRRHRRGPRVLAPGLLRDRDRRRCAPPPGWRSRPSTAAPGGRPSASRRACSWSRGAPRDPPPAALDPEPLRAR